MLCAEELEKVFFRAEKQASEIKRQLSQLRFADEKVKSQAEILRELNNDEDVGPETIHAAREKLHALKLEARSKLMGIHSDLTQSYLPRKEILEEHLDLTKKIIKRSHNAESPKASIAEPTRKELNTWSDILSNMLPANQIEEILDRVKRELEEDLKITKVARGQVETKEDVEVEDAEQHEDKPQEKKPQPQVEPKIANIETAGRPAAPTLEKEAV